MSKLRPFVLLCCAIIAQAQDVTCNSGDIAWVSSAINADVGLASGAARCLANTVAGGNYNDSGVPFGIQGALDCACAGSEVNILGDTGNYGSLTNSWNNRFNADKRVAWANNTGTKQVVISGFSDTSTECDTLTATGCPVLMTFASGTGVGWQVERPATIRGLRVTAANSHGWSFVGPGIQASLSNSEVDNNGGWGVSVNMQDIAIILNEIHDNTSGGINTLNDRATVMWNDFYDATGPGAQLEGLGTIFSHNVVLAAGGDCVVIGGTAQLITWNTLRGCTGDGIDVFGAPRDASVGYNLITDNGGWGINSVVDAGRVAPAVVYNVFDGNSSGTFNTANVNETNVNIVDFNQSATVTYVSATDSRPTAGAAITFTFPRGLTTVSLNVGAFPNNGP